MKKINLKWLIVGGGVLLSALEALSNLVSVSDTAIAALWSRDSSQEADQQLTFDVLTDLRQWAGEIGRFWPPID